MKNNLFNIYVIGLDNTNVRFKNFIINNPYLDAKFFKGIDGKQIDKEERIKLNLIKSDCPLDLTDGSTGCALSHRKLWEITAQQKVGSLILEDDVITHPKIVDFININYEGLMKFDITLFSVNTNSILDCTSPEGVRTLNHFYERYPKVDDIKKILGRTNIDSVKGFKLYMGFGHSAYFVSPEGAKLLKSKIFPFSGLPIRIPYVNENLIPVTQDIEANRYYPTMKAIVCNPFLAYTPNVESTTEF